MRMNVKVEREAEPQEKIDVQRRRRVILYSHDTMGLGHIRRNILIANALSNYSSDLDILLIAGIREANSFVLPKNVDGLTLPSLFKESSGRYKARSLGIPLRDILRMRSQMILSTIKSFQPDIFIVDNVPRGACLELDDSLAYLKKETQTKIVLGLRDIKDETEVVRREWKQHRYQQTLKTYFDQIWIYGDPDVFDSVAQYGFNGDLISKVRYTGYFNQQQRLRAMEIQQKEQILEQFGLKNHKYILCMLGGGQDGGQIARTFAEATFPSKFKGVLLTGPQMDERTKRHLHLMAAIHEHLKIIEFLCEPTVLLERAHCVIGMGGYNAISEILSFNKKTLIIPRTAPRKEQLIRAERLAELGAIDIMLPETMNKRLMSHWINEQTSAILPEPEFMLNMCGLNRIPVLMEHVLNNKKE